MNMLTDPIETHLAQLLSLRRQAIASHQRRLVVISGELPWSLKLANALADHLTNGTSDKTLWIAREWPEPSNRLQQIIGGECQLLIFNGHHGFDPNLFGAAAGTVTGGGLIILLAPEFNKWQTKSDPVSSRIAVYPHLPESIPNRYIERLIKHIEAETGASQLTILHQSSPPDDANSERERQTTGADGEMEPPQTVGSPDQQRAIEAITRTATGHRHRPLVLTADRGRGKSAALGIAAAQLIKLGKRRIIVTAPARTAVDNLFLHAEAELGNREQTAALEFIAPDRLSLQSLKADLVLVDEAAAIPTPILSKILQDHSRVIFSTTTHGYEGSGQGFALRFVKQLKAQCPDYQALHLEQPIRWAVGDPVEMLVNRLLILDAEPELPDGLLRLAANQIDHIERVDQAQLAGDEEQLRQLFGLLVLAHYRTTPLDLRQLLDGPNLSIYIATHRNTIVATALVADEGEIGIDPDDSVAQELIDDIWLGKRRPQGHLLPQTLIAHLGIKEAAPLRYRRIIRIAVHPSLQRKGIGKELMNKISADAATDQIDILGTSYGATGELMQFWRKNHFSPIFIGSHRNASSGTYALSEMNAITTAGSAIVDIAKRRFQNGLVAQLRDPLQQLDDDIVCMLLQPQPTELEPYDLGDIKSFVDGNRRYETVITPLTQLLLNHFNELRHLSPRHQQLLIMKLLQNHPWEECASRLKMDGRNSTLSEMRLAISQLTN